MYIKLSNRSQNGTCHAFPLEHNYEFTPLKYFKFEHMERHSMFLARRLNIKKP